MSEQPKKTTVIEEIQSKETSTLKEPSHSKILQNIARHLVGKLEVSTEGQDKQKDYELLVRVVDQILLCCDKLNHGIKKSDDLLFLYTGTHWTVLEEDVLKSFLGQSAQKLGVIEEKAKYYRFRENLYEQCKSAAKPLTPIASTDIKINLVNGTYCINGLNQRLSPFNPSDGLKHLLPFEFNPNAKAQKFQDYLDTVVPYEECQKILAEYVGYLFLKNKQLKLEKILMCYGPGGNGKSVFFDVICALLGPEHVCNYSLQSLCNSQGYTRAMLRGKLLNYSSEISGKLESDVFKLLASGEPIEARLPYGKPFIMNDYARMIFNINEFPSQVELTDAFFRRFLIIPFLVKITKDQTNKRLANEIIETELPGIFNWALSGLNRLIIQQRFTESEQVNQILQQFQKESNSVNLFLDENNYVPSTKSLKQLSDIFYAYNNFCSDCRCPRVDRQTFKKRLSDLGFNPKRTSKGWVVYLEVNHQKED